ncbi:MAG TPA: extracellular solute-binding protein [Bacillales bacterium]|nr:extracellular solute-binding protein [Bacillales bacterium]
MGLYNAKKLVAIIGAVLLVFVTSACGSSEQSAGSGQTLKVIYSKNGTNDPVGKWLKKVEQQFEEQHANVDVNVVPVKGAEGTFTSKKALMLQSEETTPDVITEDTYLINSDAAAGYLAPIEDRVKKWDGWDHFIKKVKQGVTASDGKIYGVPYSTDTRGLWYDVNLFEKAGLPVPWHPKNWQDVLNAAQKIKQSFPDVIPFWMNSGKATGEATTMQTFEMLLYGTNNTLYDEESGKWIVKSPGFLDSLKFIDTIYEKGLGPKLSQVLTGQAGTVEHHLMRKEKIAIALDGNWVPAFWRENGPNPWPEAMETYHFAAMPTQHGQGEGHTSMSGGWALSIPAKSDQKDLAWEFIKLATNKENMMFADISMGNLPARKDVEEAPEYEKALGRAYKKAAQFLKFTHYRPTFEGYTSVSSAIQAAVEAVATDSLEPKAAMNQYAKDVKRAVGADNVVTK